MAAARKRCAEVAAKASGYAVTRSSVLAQMQQDASRTTRRRRSTSRKARNPFKATPRVGKESPASAPTARSEDSAATPTGGDKHDEDAAAAIGVAADVAGDVALPATADGEVKEGGLAEPVASASASTPTTPSNSSVAPPPPELWIDIDALLEYLLQVGSASQQRVARSPCRALTPA